MSESVDQFPDITDTDKKRLVKKKAMLSALTVSMGIVSTASKKANVHRSTHYDYVNDDPQYKEYVEAIDEYTIDFAESNLHKLINGYDYEEVVKEPNKKKPGEMVTTKITTKKVGPDKTAIIFFLKTKGRQRGYIERIQVEPIAPQTDFSKHSTKDLLHIVHGNTG